VRLIVPLAPGGGLNEVSYKGGGPALLAAAAGEIPLVFTSLAAGATYLDSGRLKGLGITTSKRHPAAPSTPTFAEAGVDGFVIVNWYGLLAPAGTPVDIVQLLNREIVKALDAPQSRERLRALTFDPTPTTSKEAEVLVKAELARWQDVVAKTRTPQH
jgi:tripartite-type tricarboxylate transporter receptor subunit TctC